MSTSDQRESDLDDEAARYHREVYDWESPDPADEMHGRGLDFGLLLLRLTVLMLLPHGLAKAGDIEGFIRVVDDNLVGSQAPELFGWLIMLGQVALPVLIAIGLFTRPAAFLCAGMMAAIWSLAIASRLDYTLLSNNGGLTGENALLFTFLPLALVFTGAGRWSLDAMRTDGRP